MLVVENELGHCEVFCASRDESGYREREKQIAVSECLRLAAELRGTDPARAQRLEALAADERQSAHALFGEVKQDGREPREPGAEVAGGGR